MTKKILVPVVLFIVLTIGVGFYLDILTFNRVCGFKTSYSQDMEKRLGKEWECKCLGRVTSIEGDSLTRYYCTGINLSLNKIIEYLETKNSKQYPISVD